MTLTIALAFTLLGTVYSYEGIALGGYGATNFIELIEKDGICGGENVTPVIPNIIPGANPTWVAEYVDDAIYLCGGQVNPKLYSF